MSKQQRIGLFVLGIIVIACAILAAQRFDIVTVIKRLHGMAALPIERGHEYSVYLTTGGIQKSGVGFGWAASRA